jgi:hypothetical protein
MQSDARRPPDAARRCASLVAVAALSLGTSGSQAEGDAAAEKIAAVEQALRTGMAALRQYEWVETTTLTHKGEPQATKQSRCRYGADGALERVPIPEETVDDPGSAPRGKVSEKKKRDMADYLEESVGLIKQYVPPDAARVLAVKEAGRAAVQRLAEHRHELRLRDYLKAGDVLSVYFDPATDILLELRVSTYFDKPKDAASFDVTLGRLSDGAIYASEVVFLGLSRDIQLNLRNTAHRPVGSGE